MLNDHCVLLFLPSGLKVSGWLWVSESKRIREKVQTPFLTNPLTIANQGRRDTIDIDFLLKDCRCPFSWTTIVTFTQFNCFSVRRPTMSIHWEILSKAWTRRNVSTPSLIHWYKELKRGVKPPPETVLPFPYPLRHWLYGVEKLRGKRDNCLRCISKLICLIESGTTATRN